MPTRHSPPWFSARLVALWSLSQPGPGEHDPPRMSTKRRLMGAAMWFLTGAVLAAIIMFIVLGPDGRTVGWAIIGGVVGMIVGLAAQNALWKRRHDPLNQALATNADIRRPRTR
jgi:hypothetical protein